MDTTENETGFEGSAMTPERKAQLNTLLALHRLRAHLTADDKGWTQGELWDDQDAPYSGQGPTCLMGGAAVAVGRGNLTNGQDMDAAIDHHPVTLALYDTLRATYARQGRPADGYRAVLWDVAPTPGDKLAVWNDDPTRTKREVVALVDAAIERLGES